MLATVLAVGYVKCSMTAGALATYVHRVLTCRGDLGRPVRLGRLRQLLHERGISFQRTRTWKESTDPDRDAKLDRIG